MEKKRHKGREEWHGELQDSLRETLVKMAKSGCDLPDDIDLYFCIGLHSGRDKYKLTVKPFLTKENADRHGAEEAFVDGDGILHTYREGSERGKDGYQYKYETVHARKWSIEYELEWFY